MAAEQKTNMASAERIKELITELESRPSDEVHEELRGALIPLEDITMVRRLQRKKYAVNHSTLDGLHEDDTDPTVIIRRPFSDEP